MFLLIICKTRNDFKNFFPLGQNHYSNRKSNFSFYKGFYKATIKKYYFYSTKENPNVLKSQIIMTL